MLLFVKHNNINTLEMKLAIGYNVSKFYYYNLQKEFFMGQPKKQSSPRKTGTRRSHLRLELARRVNKTSPVKVRTTKRESGKALS